MVKNLITMRVLGVLQVRGGFAIKVAMSMLLLRG